MIECGKVVILLTYDIPIFIFMHLLGGKVIFSVILYNLICYEKKISLLVSYRFHMPVFVFCPNFHDNIIFFAKSNYFSNLAHDLQLFFPPSSF